VSGIGQIGRRAQMSEGPQANGRELQQVAPRLLMELQCPPVLLERGGDQIAQPVDRKAGIELTLKGITALFISRLSSGHESKNTDGKDSWQSVTLGCEHWRQLPAKRVIQELF
jgi:hypothetical protein